MWKEFRMKSLYEVCKKEMRLNASKFAIRCLAKVAEYDILLLVGVHRSVTFVFSSKGGKGEISVERKRETSVERWQL